VSFTYRYARPALTADCVVLTLEGKGLSVLLIRRANPPFQRQWALPGGFAEVGESLETTAQRELYEETGLKDLSLEQLHTYSDPQRDPREHVVTVAYLALVNRTGLTLRAASDASDAAWFALDALPALAFDHAQILETARARLREKIARGPLGFELLPRAFPLRKLQELYEAILGHPLDKRNFRKKILSLGILDELDALEDGVGHRAARLYRVNGPRYAAKVRQGFDAAP